MRRGKTRSANGPSGAGVLGALRQLLSSRRPRLRVKLRRRKGPEASPPPTSPAVEHSSVSSSPLRSATGPWTATKPAGVAIPAPPRDPNADESDDDSSGEASRDEHDEHDDSHDSSQTMTKKKRKTKRSRTSSTWVAKLLNQVAPPKDRVHSRKKRQPRTDDASRSTVCHEMLRVVKDPYPPLLARVFDFLQPLEPGRYCVLVNRAIAVSVARYYAQYCEWPRPRAYLADKLLGSRHAESAGVLSRVLGMLSAPERVSASATSQVFRRIVDALPLEFSLSDHAVQFLCRLDSSRVEARFQHTKTLRCERIAARDAVRLLRFMSDDNGDHFLSIQHIALVRLPGFESENQFVELVQSLFSDRISRSLQSLVLSNINIDDANFRQLARLFYDGHFPNLEALDLSCNLFPSRFMRDWSRSFHEERFKNLTSLDVSGVGMSDDDMTRFFECLHHVPKLRKLNISHNYCSVANMHSLAKRLQQHSLLHLELLSCSAVSASDHGMHVLVDALGTHGVCPDLQSLDVSGNDLSTGDQTMRSLGDAFMSKCWPKLHYLNISFTKPTTRGFELLARALSHHGHDSLRTVHLAGNALEGDAFESLIVALLDGVFRQVETLNLSDNNLGSLEFELLAHALSLDACPSLQTLLLAGNNAKSDGVTRFRRFFSSRAAKTIHTLDLSGNSIPSNSLTWIADELMKSCCSQLQILNVSRNMPAHSVGRFQKLIRSNKCPSLACIQIGYAQSEEQGYAFVRTTRSKMSVEELRRLKQLQFEARMKRIQEENGAKAKRAAARCKRQTKLLREMYDQMESEADRALRRRKRVRKSPHLLIHEEIERLKQDKHHEKVCRDLERALAFAQPV